MNRTSSVALVAVGLALPLLASRAGAETSTGITSYQQVRSLPLHVSAGAQAPGTVSCPSGTKVVGGGVVSSGSLNGSFPSTDGRMWTGYVNNASGSTATFYVYADCASKVAKYSIVAGTGVDNPAGTQRSSTVTCPSGSVPLGGGGLASSQSTAVNLNSSIPTSHGWSTDVNNASPGGDTATSYVVCGRKPGGYVQVVGPAATVETSREGLTAVDCPAGADILGGGAYSNSGSTAVNLTRSYPSASIGWSVGSYDGSAAATTVAAYAICAKTS